MTKKLSFAAFILAGIFFTFSKETNKSKTGSVAALKPKERRDTKSMDVNSKKLTGPAENLSSKNPSGETEVGELWNEFERIKRCQMDGNCKVEGLDSRGEDRAPWQEFLGKLQHFNLELRENRQHRPEVAKFAQELLGVDDGSVKEEALKLMLSQDSEAGNVEAVVQSVLGYHDGNLIEDALEELQRHLLTDRAPQIHASLGATLLSGSLLVREALSEKITPFINRDSYDYYRELSKHPLLTPPLRQNLLSQLREWELQQTGG